MNINLDEAIETSKEMLEDNGKYFDFLKYCCSYLFTTEQIRRYLEYVSFNTGKALTVLSSGDHVFDLVFKGVYNIDAFDINELAYFWYWFKFAALRSLTFEEFQDANDEIWYLYDVKKFSLLIEKIKYFMPEKVYLYFKSLIHYQMQEQNSDGLSPLVRKNQYSHSKASTYYLYSKDNYYKLQSKLDNLKINFFFGDANRDIPAMVPGGYDVILLSNISDFLGLENEIGIEEFRNYLAKYYQLLNQNGILINYLFYFDDDFIINNSHITKDSLEGYIHSFLDGEGYLLVRKPNVSK